MGIYRALSKCAMSFFTVHPSFCKNDVNFFTREHQVLLHSFVQKWLV